MKILVRKRGRTVYVHRRLSKAIVRSLTWTLCLSPVFCSHFQRRKEMSVGTDYQFLLSQCNEYHCFRCEILPESSIWICWIGLSGFGGVNGIKGVENGAAAIAGGISTIILLKKIILDEEIWSASLKQPYLVFVVFVVAAKTHGKRNYQTTYDLWHFVVAAHTVSHLVPVTLLVEFYKRKMKSVKIFHNFFFVLVHRFVLMLTWATDWHFFRRTFSVPVVCVPGKVPDPSGTEIRWYPVTKDRL